MNVPLGLAVDFVLREGNVSRRNRDIEFGAEGDNIGVRGPLQVRHAIVSGKDQLLSATRGSPSAIRSYRVRSSCHPVHVPSCQQLGVHRAAGP